VILAQIAYPLVDGGARATLVVLTVLLGFAASVGHAATRGWRVAAAMTAVTVGGGFAVEAVGVATGFPFGAYAYTAALGPRLLGVPVVVPLAWTWMAWPAWVAAGHIERARGGERASRRRLRAVRGPVTQSRAIRVGVGALGLATWDLFLDPQMVAAGYWRWSTVDIPLRNYVAWLVVAAAMMVALDRLAGGERRPVTVDAPVLGLYLWTYGSSVLAHAVFLDLPRSALLGGIGMGLVAIPLTVSLARR
jgi:putative membrane protein